jgi:release factor glutamine methyltransferase
VPRLVTAQSAAAVDFGGLTITFAPSVLAPRPWTTAQARWAAELLRDAPPGPILELCAGGGQIGLLTAVLSDRALVAVDLNPEAAACVRQNAAAAGLADRVEVRCASLESALEPDEVYPFIVADPPWVRHDHVWRFPDDPPLAIDGGADGLQAARMCADVVDRHLHREGSALLQLGTADQVDRLRRELPRRGTDLVVTGHRAFPRGQLVRLQKGSAGAA